MSGAPSASSIGSRFVRGSVYMTAASWATLTVGFGVQIGVARLLGPAELGIYAFALAIHEILNIVGAFSIGAALVQARTTGQSAFDTGFAINAGLGLVGLLAAGAAALVVGRFQGAEVAWLVVVMALGRIAVLLARVPHASLERDVRYGRVAAIALSGSLLSNAVGLGLAFYGLGAWSLVVRDLMVASITLGLALKWSQFRFQGRVRREAARSIMNFARPMFFSRTLEIILVWFDRLTVGALFGAAAVGFYHQARFLAEAGTVATRPISQLSFNLYARVQDQSDLISRSYTLVNFFLIRIVFSGALVLLLFPEETVRLLLGEAWIEAAPILRWLGLYAACLPLFENLKLLLTGLGHVGSTVRIRAMQLTAFAPGVLIASQFQSLAGVAVALATSTGLAFVLGWIATRKLVPSRSAVSLFGVPLAIAALVLACPLAFEGQLETVPWWARPFLPVGAFIGGLLLVEGRRWLHELGFLMDRLRAPLS